MVDVQRSPSYLFSDPQPSPGRRVLNAIASGETWRQLAERVVTSLVSTTVRARHSAAGSWERRDEIALERYEALKALLTLGSMFRAAPYMALFLLAFLPSLVLGVGFQGGFNSPDETTRYLAAKTFAETGQLYIEDEITLAEPSYATGPRAYAQHNGRSVPTYSQMPLVLFGIASYIFGAAAPAVLAVIPGALFVTLALIVRRMLPSAPAYLPWILLGVTPLWYWTSRVYMDIAVTFLFIAVALMFLVRAIQTRSERHLFYGGAALGIAALARIPEAPLLFMFGVAFALALGHLTSADRNGHLRLGAIYGASLLASFFIPLLVLNWWTNGSPTTISYTLLYEQHFPELVEPAGNILLEPFRLVWFALFPQPVDFSIIYATFVYQVLLFNPYLLLIGLVGIIQYGGVLARKFGGYGVGVLLLTFVYMFLSRNAPGTFLAGVEEPDLRASLVRYWMPFYLLLGIGAVLALHRLPHRYSLVLVAAFVISSAYSIWYDSQESVANLERSYGLNSERYAAFYDQHTEPEALIVAGSSFDKWTVPYRRTIGIWPDTATETNLRHLADTGAAAVRRGQPVYYMFGPREPANAVAIVLSQLEPQYLGLRRVATEPFAGDLWKITSNPQTLELSEQLGPTGVSANPSGGFGAPGEPPSVSTTGEYVTSFTAPGRKFTLNIANDGSARNLITNPSFETGSDLWAGPNEQGVVEVSREYAAFGRSSLRMELSPAAKAGERVRRTYKLPLDDLDSGNWDLRAMVRVDELHNAAVEMIVYIDGAEGKRLDRAVIRTEAVSPAFVPLVIKGPDLPAAEVLSIQVSIVANSEGGSGVVFWDGIELNDGPVLAGEYCDGDNFGCDWEGQPHASPSSRSAGVMEVEVESAGVRVDIDRPLRSGDRVVFDDGLATINRADGGFEVVGTYDSIAAGETVQVTLTAESKPVVSVVGP